MVPDAAGAAAQTQREDDRTVRVEVGTTVDEAERQLILKTLQSTHNNKTRAAEILGITTKTLQNKLKEYSNAESGGSRAETPAVAAE
jgi:DNA-binding NtrC family response regulator